MVETLLCAEYRMFDALISHYPVFPFSREQNSNILVEENKNLMAPLHILKPIYEYKHKRETRYAIPFTFPHLPCKFLQLFTLSIWVFNLIQLLETISEYRK